MLQHVLRTLRPRRGAEIRWVNAGIGIGGVQKDEDWQDIFKAGVRAVVDLREECADLGAVVRGHGMRYLHLCLQNPRAPSAEELQIVTSWVLDRVAEDGHVLIQDGYTCFHDGLVAVAALIKSGLPPHLALLALHRARPGHSFDNVQNSELVRFTAAQAAAP